MVKHPILNGLKQQIHSLLCYVTTLGQRWTLVLLVTQGPRLTEKPPSQTFTSPPCQREWDRIINALPWKWHTLSVHNTLARSTHIFPSHYKKARKCNATMLQEGRKLEILGKQHWWLCTTWPYLYLPQACKVDHACYSKLNCVLLKQDFLLI